MIQLAAISDVGLFRTNNEDAWDARPLLGLFALADGMGGHQAGEVAAREAVSMVCRLLEKEMALPPSSPEERTECLAQAIQEVNSAVFAKSWEDASLQGMGTTLCLLHWTDSLACYAHVGDSRIYYWDGSRLHRLTHDHTVAAELIEAGIGEASVEGLRHRLTRAVGTGMTIEVATGILPATSGVFLLCSDGLTEALSDDLLFSFFQEHSSLQELATLLVEQAKERHSHDNITVLLAARPGGTTRTATPSG
ncbi:MAG: PP2C family protein-serine/threonine phosphatase [Chlamydiia bacterium]